MARADHLAVVSLVAVFALTSCHRDVDDIGSALKAIFPDRPTSFKQGGPISLTTSEESFIFKSPSKSNNCFCMVSR